MPIYEYVCRTCRHRFETLVRGAATPVCPSCSSTALDKQLSVFAVGPADSGGPAPAPSPCGSCGDPRGPGACTWN